MRSAEYADLWAWIETQHDAAEVALFQAHLHHPRFRPDYVRVLGHANAIDLLLLIRHTTHALGTVRLELADLTIIPAQVHTDLARWAEAILAEVLPILAEAEIGLLRIMAPPAEFSDFGMVPLGRECLTTPPDPRAARAAPPSMWEATSIDLAALLIERRDPALRDDLNALGLDPLSLPAGTIQIWRDQHGVIQAYTRQQRQALIEAGVLDAGVALTLLEQLPPSCQLALPISHPLTRAALFSGWQCQLKAYPATAVAPLYGIVDVQQILIQLAPLLTQRLHASRYATWQGVIRFELAHSWLGVQITRGGVLAVPGNSAADIRLRRVTLTGLTELLLGQHPAALLRATGQLHCDDIALGLLDTLFPTLLA
jgi:hypothetical protein